MVNKQEELLKLSEELVAIQKDGNEHSYKEFFEILKKIKATLDPNFLAIPSDLKKSIGIATATAVASPDPESRVDIVRAGLSLLRTAVTIAGGPDTKNVLDKISLYEHRMNNKLANINPETMSPEAQIELYDAVWRATNYLVFMSFNGYGEITSAGFNWTGEDTK